MTNAPTNDQAPGARCAICDAVELDAVLISTCYDCGDPFHLNPYSNRPGIDCGDAVLGENLGLYFFCQRCLDVRDREASARFGSDAESRADAMITAVHGNSLGLPTRAEPAVPPPAPGRSARPRRRYRRIDTDRP